jgi:hypothetical protein
MQRYTTSFVSFAVAACAAITIAACSKSNSATSPLQPAVIDGTWSGALSDANIGTGTLSLYLNQLGDSVTGTWTSSYPDPNNDVVGTVFGTVGGSTLTIVLKPDGGSTCQFSPLKLIATVTTAGSMSGTVANAYPCIVSDSGSFNGTKQ